MNVSLPLPHPSPPPGVSSLKEFSLGLSIHYVPGTQKNSVPLVELSKYELKLRQSLLPS